MRRFFSLLVLAVLALPNLARADDPPAADGPGGFDAVKTWARARTQAAQAGFTGTRMPSPSSWADQTVYQIQVDRFNDGDPSNNNANVSAFQQAHRTTDQLGLEDYHHGGDLQGIIDRLPYLQELGVTTLWITPVFKNAPAYHGYCTSDFTQIDPNFGSTELLVALTRDAHARGMRVVLDIVVNHMCSNDSSYDPSQPFQDSYYQMCVDDQNAKRWAGGGQVRGQRTLQFGPSFFAPFRSQYFFSRCGFRANDFASNGNGAVFGDFSDRMFDFDTMNHDFQDIFTELHKYWIAVADIDGFRLDAAKHVTEDYLATFSTNVRSYAESLGKQDFFLVAEVAASPEDQARRVGKMRANDLDPGDPSANIAGTLRNRLFDLESTYLGHEAFPFPGTNAVYDFSHSGITVDVLHQAPGRSPREIKNWFWAGGELDHDRCGSGYCELAFNGEPLLNWNMIEIHDWPRFAQHEFGGDRGRLAGQLRAALGYLLTAPGVPVLYYGVEQGLEGNCPSDADIVLGAPARSEIQQVCNSIGDGRKRQDMFIQGPWRLRSLEPSIDALAHIGFDQANPAPTGWQDDPYLDRNQDLYRYARKLLAIRRSCSPLRRGNTYFRADADATGGLLAFSRIADGREILVLVNTGDGSIPVSALFVDNALHAGHDFEVFRNLLAPSETGTLGKLGGGMGLYFPAGYALSSHTIAIFGADNQLQPFDPALGAQLCADDGKADARGPVESEGGCRVTSGADGGLVLLALLGLRLRDRRARRGRRSR